MKIAICDDDRGTVASAEQAIEKMAVKDLTCDCFFGGEELLAYLETHPDDYGIYLMDIKMPHPDGIETAARIRERDRDGLIIFMTDYQDYVYQVFEVQPFRFLRKPVSPAALRQAVTEGLEQIRRQGRLFFYKIGRETCQLPCSRILYFESRARKMVIHTAQGERETYGRMADVLAALDPLCFAQIHGSFIINLEYLRSIRTEAVLMADGELLPVSRRFKGRLKKAHLDFIERRCRWI